MTNQRINILLKPTDECNLRCKYCFHEKTGYKTGVMSKTILNRIIELISNEYSRVHLVWHGGELLIPDISFYKYAYEAWNKKDVEIQYSIQTNGTLLNDQFLQFFKTNNTNIGYRLDNILNIDSIAEVFENEKFVELIEMAIKRRNMCKLTCDVYKLCYGGCNANAELNGNIELNNYDFCQMHKQIINNISSEIHRITELVRNNNIDKAKLNPKFILLTKM